MHSALWLLQDYSAGKIESIVCVELHASCRSSCVSLQFFSGQLSWAGLSTPACLAWDENTWFLLGYIEE